MTLYTYIYMYTCIRYSESSAEGPVSAKILALFQKTRAAASFQVKKGVPFADAEAVKGQQFRSAVGWFRLRFVFIESGRRYRFILDSDNMDLYKAKLVYIF